MKKKEKKIYSDGKYGISKKYIKNKGEICNIYVNVVIHQE